MRSANDDNATLRAGFTPIEMLGIASWLLVLGVSSLCPTLTLPAFINSKQHKCSPPQSPKGLKPVSLEHLPVYTSLTVHHYAETVGSQITNRTMLLDAYFPEEWNVLHLSLRRLFNRAALITVACRGLNRHNFLVYYMLIQSASGRTLWIKKVIESEQNFYGFRYGWSQAFLKLDPSHESFILKVCHFQQLQLIIGDPLMNRTCLRCSEFDTEGRKRIHETGGLGTLQKFLKLAWKICTTRVYYPYGTMRLFVLILLVAFGFYVGYFSTIWTLLKRIIR